MPETEPRRLAISPMVQKRLTRLEPSSPQALKPSSHQAIKQAIKPSSKPSSHQASHQAIKPLMIKLGSRHAAMKNNANEAMTKRYVAQDSSDFTVALDRSNSDAAISQATSGRPTPRTNPAFAPRRMSALGQKRTFSEVCAMSALPRKADTSRRTPILNLNHYIDCMCGRVIQSGGPIRYAIVDGLDVRDSRAHNYPPRWNAAPGQELLVIRRNHDTGVVSLDPLRWGLIPHWCQDPTGGRKPINAKCETVDRLPMFKDAYRRRRCILPVDGFFEWKAIKSQKAKQPYAIAMKDGKPFGIGGLWENWKDPVSGEWMRTFVVITTDANEMVAQIHNRMPLILAPGDYVRWLSDESDPRDLLRPFPAEPMRMWPISTLVNKPENDDQSIVEPIVLANSAA